MHEIKKNGKNTNQFSFRNKLWHEQNVVNSDIFVDGVGGWAHKKGDPWESSQWRIRVVVAEVVRSD